MNEIRILDKNTIDKIAAGEVIERPANIVKELMENSIDAKASSISVEINEGGIGLIRVTDNGEGIEKNQIKNAFLRHSTSKISTAEDLSFIHTLGFRGEALSSIAAVSRVEMCTKTESSLTGSIYKISGGEEVSLSDAGLPDGTTIIIRNLFYNTPARLKFLKSEKTEALRVAEAVIKIALSHPDTAVKLTVNGKIRINTPGNRSLKDTVYAIYGMDIASNLLKINSGDAICNDTSYDLPRIGGFIGKPELSRGNRAMELYFVNGRFVTDSVISSAIEDAYKGFMMKGTYPVTFLTIDIEPELIDVNVHPSKMEIRFRDSEGAYRKIYESVRAVITGRESIPYFTLNSGTHTTESFQQSPEPDMPAEKKSTAPKVLPEPFEIKRAEEAAKAFPETSSESDASFNQISFDSEKFISKNALNNHKIIGVVFDTYWIVEYSDKIYLIDQHAAHEKVLYEKFLKRLRSEKHYSQMISPPIIVSLNPSEEAILSANIEKFNGIGFEISHFGGSEYAISALPADMYTLNDAKLFISFLAELAEEGSAFSSEMLLDRIATAACKAAVKGGDSLSLTEARQLIEDLLILDNPYNCPHGRPTIITMSKNELERKFKRLV